MTKEKFKILITQQFKQTYHPIHALMLTSEKRNPACRQKHQFRNKEFFYASEFGLCVEVDCLEGEFGHPSFQLRFIDIPSTHQLVESWKPYDLCSKEILLRQFNLETIIFRGETLIFALKEFTLNHQDYVFDYDNVETRALMTYNVTTRKFEDRAPAKSLFRWARWKQLGVLNETCIPYSFSPAQEEVWQNFITTRSLEPGYVAELESLFRDETKMTWKKFIQECPSIDLRTRLKEELNEYLQNSTMTPLMRIASTLAAK